jgi:hypothetical protein
MKLRRSESESREAHERQLTGDLLSK